MDRGRPSAGSATTIADAVAMMTVNPMAAVWWPSRTTRVDLPASSSARLSGNSLIHRNAMIASPSGADVTITSRPMQPRCTRWVPEAIMGP